MSTLFECVITLYFVYNLSITPGEGADLSSFHYSGPFRFLLIEFHFTFSYKMLQFYVYYYFILIGSDRPSGLLFFCALFTSFHTHTSLLAFIVCFFILFHSCCSNVLVSGKTLVHEFPISYSHTEWYLFSTLVKAMNNWKRIAINQILLN